MIMGKINESIKLGKYKHYKGGLYEVIGECVHSETLEWMVLYKTMYDSPKFPKGTLWVRPKKIFLETVKIEGKNVPRFKYIGDERR